MSAKHFIYAAFPFIVGLIAKKIMDIPDTSYWFYVSLACILSVFIFVKVILPSIDSYSDFASQIDVKYGYDKRVEGQKPYSYIVGLHILTFIIIIVLYFTN